MAFRVDLCSHHKTRVAISVVTKVKTKEIDIFSDAADVGLVFGSRGLISGSRSELKYPNSGTLSASWLWRVWRAATPSTSWKRVRDFSEKNRIHNFIFGQSPKRLPVQEILETKSQSYKTFRRLYKRLKVL